MWYRWAWYTTRELTSTVSHMRRRSRSVARDAAFRSGDRLALRAAKRKLTAGVKRAKAAYAQKIQGHFTSNNPRSMWRGLKCITNYNTRDVQCPRDPSLPDAPQQLLRPLRRPEHLPQQQTHPSTRRRAPQPDPSRIEEDPPQD